MSMLSTVTTVCFAAILQVLASGFIQRLKFSVFEGRVLWLVALVFYFGVCLANFPWKFMFQALFCQWRDLT